MLVYGLQDEDPQSLLSEFADMTEDPIYVCRFLASKKNGKYYLRGTIANAETETSEDEKSKTMNCNSPMDISPKKFSIITVDENETIKLRITKVAKHDSTNKVQDGPEKENCVDNSPDVSTINQNFKNMLINVSPEHKNFQPVVLLNKLSNTLSSPEPNQSTQTDNITLRKSKRNALKSREVQTCRSSKRQSVKHKSFSHFYDSPDKSIVDDDVLNSPPKQARMEATVTSKNKKMNSSTPNTGTVSKTPKTTDIITPTTRSKATPSRLVEKVGTAKQKRVKEIDVEITPKKIAKNRRLRLFNHVTPVVKERDAPMEVCDSPMSRARLGLSAHTMPKKMPCRESEYTNIHNFVSIRIKQQSSGYVVIKLNFGCNSD